MGLFSRSFDPRSGRDDIPPPPTGGLVGWLKKQVGLGLDHEAEAAKERVASGTWQKDFPLFLPYIDDKTGETATMRKQYRLMWADPNVKAACAGKIINVAALDIRCLPADEDDPDSIEHAEFLDWTINECLEGGMHGLVWSLLSGGCTDGYSILEKITEVEEGGQWAGKLVMSALKPKVVDDNLILEQDPFGNVTGIKGLKWNAGIHFDPRHFLIYRHFPLYGAPTGMSDFRAAYGKFWMLDTITKLRAWGIEKRAVPLLLGTYPMGQTSLKSTLDTALKNCKSSHWLSAPEGCKVEAINIASSGDEIFKSAILDLKHDIFLAIKFASLQNVEGQSGDRRGNSQVQKDESELLPWFYAKEIETLFNSRKHGLIRNDIIGPNFYTQKYPKLKVGAVDINEQKAEMEIWDAGAKLTKLSKKRFFAAFPTLAPPLDEEDEIGGQPQAPGMPGGIDPDNPLGQDDDSTDDAPEKFGERAEVPIEDKPWTDTPQSSWVKAFRYSAFEAKMQIEFNDNAICEYDDIEPRVAHNFRRVASKGKAVWRDFYDLPYQLVQDAERHGKLKTKANRFRVKGGLRKHAEADWSPEGSNGQSRWVHRRTGQVVYGQRNPEGATGGLRRADLEERRAKERTEAERAVIDQLTERVMSQLASE